MMTVMRRMSLLGWGTALLFAAGSAGAAVRVEYDAAKAGVTVDPTGVTPAWTLYGAPMVNNGTFLLQDNTADNPVQGSGEYLSPSAGAGLMTHGSGDYGIEFRVRALTDVAFIGSHWPELYVTWSDNSSNYNVTIDLDADDAGPITTGSIVYGRGSFSPAITGIDWSVPHTVFIGYRGAADVFDFYLDGVLKSTVVWGSIARSGTFAQDSVDFGDGTTGGNDVAAEWYFIRIHDVAFPSPASGTTVISFDAAAAGAGVDPSGVIPAWKRYGTPMTNTGTLLLQDNTGDDPTTESGEYLSPAAGGLMRRGNSSYGIEFRARPLTDVPFLGSSHFANLYVTWSDDTYNYNVTIDKYTNDASGTGGIKYGANSMADAVTGIDWSAAHTIFVGYRDSADAFDFYVDNVYTASVPTSSIARSGSFARDAVDFGDGTTGQGLDVAAEWYFVKVHNVHYPVVPIPPGLLLEYDAAKAGAGIDPELATPAWSRSGWPMTNDGTLLLQDNTADDPLTEYGSYLSPPIGGLMKLGSGQYGVEFRVRPLTDLPNLGYSHYANLHVTWSDDRFNYNMTIDKDTDDDGPESTGALRYGKDSMALAVAGIDWSVPHTVYVGYRGDALPAGEFDIYVDGELKTTLGAGSIARTGSYAQDALAFGDTTNGQPEPFAIDVAAEWYFVRLYGSAAPPRTCGVPPQDVDEDGDVDLADFGAFSACFNGPNQPWSAEANQRACECLDQDNDADVDLADFGTFSACFNGPNRPAACP